MIQVKKHKRVRKNGVTVVKQHYKAMNSIRTKDGKLRRTDYAVALRRGMDKGRAQTLTGTKVSAGAAKFLTAHKMRSTSGAGEKYLIKKFTAKKPKKSKR